MPNESESTALERFARDLRRIREDRDISLATVHDHVQVSQSRLEAFEQGDLLDQPRMNRVYLKALVRAYAEAIGLPPDSVIDHFEAAVDGTYQNQLAVEVFDASPRASQGQESSAKRDDSGEEDEQSTEADGDESSLDTSPEAPSTTAPPTDSPSMPGGASAASSDESPVGQRKKPSSSARLNPESATTTNRKFWDKSRNVFGVAVAGLLVVLVLGGVLSFYLTSSEAPSSSSDPSSGTAGVAAAGPPSPDSTEKKDTLASSRQDTTRELPPATVSLGDTLYLTVFARSVVREMRVQQDDDLRRPYWIREGRALVFPFTDRITVENQLDSLRLFLEAYPYPTSNRTAEGRIVIQRSTVQQFVDTLRGPPSSIPSTPDTVDLRPPTARDTALQSPSPDSVES